MYASNNEHSKQASHQGCLRTWYACRASRWHAWSLVHAMHVVPVQGAWVKSGADNRLTPSVRAENAHERARHLHYIHTHPCTGEDSDLYVCMLDVCLFFGRYGIHL